MASEQLDVEVFIDVVKSYPELWNPAEEDYHNKNKKKEAWMNVCRTLCDGFDLQSDNYQNELCDKLARKWRNLKDYYTKQKKKRKFGQSSNCRRPYMYFKQLQFLNQAGSAADCLSNADIIYVQAESEQGKNLTTSTEGPDQSKTPCHSHDTRKRKLDPPVVYTNKAQPIPSTSDPNPDRMFFESILPYMSGFSEDQKLEFRSEVLNLIKRIKTPQQNYGYQAPSNAQQLSSPYTSYDLPQDTNPQIVQLK